LLHFNRLNIERLLDRGAYHFGTVNQGAHTQQSGHRSNRSKNQPLGFCNLLKLRAVQKPNGL
jgi:hypothetical protein